MRLRILTLGIALLLSAPATASGDPFEPLRKDPVISQGLRDVLTADKIRDECPTISARMWRAQNFLWSLARYAVDQGYDRDTVRDYVENRAEKTRVRAEAMDYLVSKGVDPDSAESFCVAGKMEIAAKSQIGALLKTR